MLGQPPASLAESVSRNEALAGSAGLVEYCLWAPPHSALQLLVPQMLQHLFPAPMSSASLQLDLSQLLLLPRLLPSILPSSLSPVLLTAHAV